MLFHSWRKRNQIRLDNFCRQFDLICAARTFCLYIRLYNRRLQKQINILAVNVFQRTHDCYMRICDKFRIFFEKCIVNITRSPYSSCARWIYYYISDTKILFLGVFFNSCAVSKQTFLRLYACPLIAFLSYYRQNFLCTVCRRFAAMNIWTNCLQAAPHPIFRQIKRYFIVDICDNFANLLIIADLYSYKHIKHSKKIA